MSVCLMRQSRWTGVILYVLMMLKLLNTSHCLTCGSSFSKKIKSNYISSSSFSFSSLLYSQKNKKKSFWLWNNNNNNVINEKNNKIIRHLSSINNNGNDENHDKKSIVAQFGDSVPKVNPLLVLPLSRRPVFPGFFATHLVKDEKTLETIIDNHRNGVSYLGLFLQKEKEVNDNTENNHNQVSKRDGNGAGDSIITSLDQVHKTGTYAQIHNVIKTARVSGHFDLRLEGE